MENFYGIIAKRTGLTVKEVRYLWPEEFEDLVIGGNSINRDYLKAKMSSCLAVSSFPSLKPYYLEAEADEIVEKVLKIITPRTGTLIKGMVTYSGVLKGKVRVINSFDDVKDVQKGEIIVTHMTSPRYMAAIINCGAIITDEGGTTCHAAIISRELQKPCIVGTKIVTKLLYTGDYVEFDGNLGVVKILEKAMDVIKGIVAYKGVVSGKVRLIHSYGDVGKLVAGEILVANMTSPRYMVAISKCGGIITDEGGMTCHAAIISRELKKPCVVGTKNATHVLKDGDLVELDGNSGIIKIIDK